jgi:hypothetical protein
MTYRRNCLICWAFQIGTFGTGVTTRPFCARVSVLPRRPADPAAQTRNRTRGTSRNFRVQMWVILASAAKEDAGFVKDKVATAARRVNFGFVMVSTAVARCDEERARRHCGPVRLIRPYCGELALIQINPNASRRLVATPRSAQLGESSGRAP